MEFVTFNRFRNAALAAGLTPQKCSQTHWKLLGGEFEVNFYPSTFKVYLKGGEKGTTVVGTLEEVIKCAFHPPHIGKMTNRRKIIPLKARKAMVERGAKCKWCRCIMQCDDATQPNYATTEHILPLNRGGSNRLDNLALACLRCNLERGDLTKQGNKK